MCNVLPCKTKKAWVPKVNMFYLKLEGMKRKIQIVFFVCVKNHLFSITTPKQEASLLSLFVDILRRSIEFGVVTSGCVWYDAPSDPVKLLMQDTRALMNFLFPPWRLGLQTKSLNWRLQHDYCNYIELWKKTFVVFMCVSKINPLR